jgi:toxin ParE1/3/4
MKVEYSNRATADLRKVSADSHAMFGGVVALALEARIRDVVTYISENPEGAPRVTERSGVRMFPLTHYPYKVFYRILRDRIRGLHIRHTSRRPWVGAADRGLCGVAVHANNRFVISAMCAPAQSSVGKPAFCSFITIERSVPASSTASAPSRRISVRARSRNRSMPAGVERS